MYWIYDLPNWQLASLICATTSLFAMAGVLLTRNFVRGRLGPEPGSNDLVSYFVSAYGVFYGLMLGLIAVGTYESFSEIESNTAHEAAELAALHHDFLSYPEPYREKLTATLREYVDYIIEKSWPAQRRGVVSGGAAPILMRLETELNAFEPGTKSQEILHAEALDKLNDVLALRRLRLTSVSTGLPATLWWVVIIGAMLNLVLCWFFTVDRLGLHLTLVGLLATFIGLVIFLIAAMDNPFRGAFSVSAEPYEELRDDVFPAAAKFAPTLDKRR